MKFLFNLLFLMVFFAPAGWAMSDGVAAVVNQHIITKKDVADEVALSLRQFTKAPKNKELFARQVLGEMIEADIKRQYAQSKGHKATPQELDMTFTRLAASNNIKVDDLVKLVGPYKNAMQKKLETQVLWDKVIEAELLPQVAVGNAEVDRIIRDVLSGDVVSEREISQIFIPAADEAGEETITEAQKALDAGTDFAAVAQKYGTGSSAAQGGYLGWFDQGALNDTLEEALEKANVGDVVGPVKSEMGWHIVKIHRVKSVPKIQFEPVEKVRLYEVRTKGDMGLKKALKKAQFLQDLKANSDIELVDKAWVYVADLSAAAQAALPQGTGLGKVVNIESKDAAFYVANRQKEMPQDLLNLRAKVETRLKNNKLQMLERKFLRQLKANTFVDIR